MTVKEMGFRNLYHKISYIETNTHTDALLEYMPNAEKATGLLLYGYIDSQCGMSFEVLACAKASAGKAFECFDGNESVSLKYRYSAVENVEIICVDNPILRQDYAEKIDKINKHYKNTDSVEETRNITIIDPYRHAEYPDDILVFLYNGKDKPEGCWVRCVGTGKGVIIGELLNEPDIDFSVHKGDLLPFKVWKNAERSMCVAMLKQ